MILTIDVRTGIQTTREPTDEDLVFIASLPVPDPKSIKAAEIRALEAPFADDAARMTRQINLQVALDWACKQAPTLTTEQVHAALMAQGTGYFKLYNLEQAVKAIRGRP